jgi:hypothetical protein
MPVRRAGRPARYTDPLLRTVITAIWRAANLPCGKRLHVIIAAWLPSYESIHGALPDGVRRQLCAMSAATLDRLLASLRPRCAKRGLCATKPGWLLKTHIPIATNQWDETRPGFLEADTVAHCGASLAGTFVYTLDCVDIATGWTEQRALWGKAERHVRDALVQIEAMLPFPLRGFDSDNGTEFLNNTLLHYFRRRKNPVCYTRSRPYHKNDNAHVEAKNRTHVRQYLGYARFDNPAILQLLNDLYTDEWRIFHNFFIPSVKLIRKERLGSRIIRVHDNPQTPAQRLLASPLVSQKTKRQITATISGYNPLLLQQQIAKKITRILALAVA